MVVPTTEILLGVTANLIYDFAKNKIVGGNKRKLRSEFDGALKLAAKELVKNNKDLVESESQVTNFLNITAEDFLLFIKSFAVGEEIDKAALLEPVKNRLIATVKQDTGIPEARELSVEDYSRTLKSRDYVGLFYANEEQIYQLFNDYLHLICSEIKNTHLLSSYYMFELQGYWGRRIQDVADEQLQLTSEVYNEIVAIRESTKRIEEYYNKLQILRPFCFEKPNYAPYPPDEQTEYARRFFDGTEPTWRDAATDFGIIRRNWREEVAESLNEIKHTKGILVSAVAGAGKSNEIRRLALQFAVESRFVVYEIPQYSAIDSSSLHSDIEIVLEKEPEGRIPVFLVDSAASSLELWEPVAEEFKGDRDIVWILCDRTERWVGALEKRPREITKHDIGVDDLAYHPLLHLNDSEIRDLVDHLLAWGILNLETARETWVRRFKDRYQGQLLVSLLELQAEEEGTGFKKRLTDEARDFKKNVKALDGSNSALGDLYPAVAALHRFGIAPTRKWLLNWLIEENSDRKTINNQAIDRAIDSRLLVKTEDGRLSCRHEVIAEVVLKGLFKGDALTDIYESWINCTNKSDEIETNELTRLFTLSVHRDRLWKIPNTLRLYKVLLAKYPSDKFARTSAAYYAIKIRRNDLAREWLGEKTTAYKEISQLLAKDAIRRGDITQAKKDYNIALGHDENTNPEEVISNIEKGPIAFDVTLLTEWASFLDTKLSRSDLTGKVYELILQEGLADSFVYHTYALFLQKQGYTNKAEKYFKEGIAADPTDAHLYQAFAIFLDKRRRYDEAEKYFKEGIAADPTDAHLYQAFALFLDKRKRYDEAEKYFREGIAAGPTDAHLYQAFAIFLDKRKRYDEAEKYFREGIAADPTDAHLYQAFALFLGKRKRYKEAEKYFREGIAVDPTDAHLYQAFAIFLDKRRRYDEAEKYFKEGIAADPTNAHLYQAFGIFLNERGRHDEAEKYFMEGIATDPTNAHLWCAFVKFYHELGFRRAGFDCGGIALKKADVNAPLTQAISLNLWNLCYYDESLEMIERGWDHLCALENPKSVKPREWAAQAQNLGEYLAIMGRQKEAIEVVSKALEYAPKDERLIRLRYAIEQPIFPSKKHLEGRLVEKSKKGKAVERSVSDFVYIHQDGEERVFSARKSKNPTMPPDAWEPGLTLVFDIWELPNGKIIAINVEFEEWQLQGIDKPILPNVTIPPVTRKR